MPLTPTPIRFYNTLTHSMQPFEPLDPPQVTMYNCGPTVYDYAHIGNYRAFVFADVLRRFLEFSGYEVHQVMNLTDVGHMTDDAVADGGGEDKMAVAARRIKEAKKQGQPVAGAVNDPDDPYQIANFYADAFIEDALSLRLKIAVETERMPRATDHISQMQTMIHELVRKGAAYQAEDGAVYFDVQKFPDYGQLSGNTLDKLRGGAGGRVDASHQAMKKHPADFLLWKPDESHVMKWDCEFGRGYPGWHIECSAMALALQGRDVIDLHTGGEDNIFPHHECEIAQSRAYTGRDRFANHWLHTRFLLVEGEKMSKSKGNFYTLRDLTDKGIDPVVLRYELLRSHYRSNMNFTWKGLEDSASAVRKLRNAASELADKAGVDLWNDELPKVANDHPTLLRFRNALADDLNMSGALAAVFEFISEPRRAAAAPGSDAAERLAVLKKIDHVLAVLHPSAAANTQSDAEAQLKAQQIDAARAAKDFATADRLREELQAAGYEVKNTSGGTVITSA